MLQGTRGGAYVVLGGSVITAYGLVGLATSNFLNAMTQLGTGDYLRLYALTFLIIVLGFATVLGGYLIASNGQWRHLAGAFLGVVGSLGGMILVLALLTTVVGLNQGFTTYGQTAAAQFNAAFEIQVIGSIIAIFFGFPLAMFGVMAGITDRRHELAENPDVASSPSS